MGNLTCSCSGYVSMSTFPDDCGAEKYGYPYLLLFMKRDGELTSCTGDSPTLAEIQAAQAAGDDNKLIVVGPMTNGVRAESEREEESGADTVDGGTNVISQTIQITGKLKYLDEDVRSDLEDLNCFTRLRMWVVTNTGWLFGGCDGYNVSNFISGLLHDGYGTRAYIPIDYKFKKPGKDPAVYDDDYLDLVNS